ncbi:Predicted phospholipase, patatin/cPLA2 family [Amphibacillus marinus]|uniref:Predicted phospholipase, patatin/cPLA2 family n=1 Tax=Amphibacillus marinus TaxID=872970 RepID=A0A1H8RBW4_9BACI|nr:patatin family protein [Amphibacillus marinus]SEO63890.1 Predicted phospholipase, patatin/cPLA2 family [Amphibacillus marinus]
MLTNYGLVLEGGGMRGLYTAGVLDYFTEKNLYFNYNIGVSAGALNAVNYLARQAGRSRDVNVTFAGDARYMNYRNLLKGKGMLNMDFLFNEVANELIPFDFEAFNAAQERLIIATTDCVTGEAVYFENDKSVDVLLAARASSSLPLVGVPVELAGYTLLDGGIVDPIPIRKSVQDGNEKHLIVLTRPKGYRKKMFRAKMTSRLMYPKYKKLIQALEQRHHVYNETLNYIEHLEAAGAAYVIRPELTEQVKRTERNPSKIAFIHQAGYEAAKVNFGELTAWLGHQPTESTYIY